MSDIFSLPRRSFRFIENLMEQNAPPYRGSYRQLFSRQTTDLVNAYVAHTGVPQSFILRPTGGNTQYLIQMERHSVGVGKHDRFLENMSALWPSDLSWPSDIPRPPATKAALEQIPEKAREDLQKQISKAKETQKKGAA